MHCTRSYHTRDMRWTVPNDCERTVRPHTEGAPRLSPILPPSIALALTLCLLLWAQPARAGDPVGDAGTFLPLVTAFREPASADFPDLEPALRVAIERLAPGSVAELASVRTAGQSAVAVVHIEDGAYAREIVLLAQHDSSFGWQVGASADAPDGLQSVP